MSGLATTAKNMIGMGRTKKRAKKGKPMRHLTKDEISGINEDLGTAGDPKRKKKGSMLANLLGGGEETL